MLFENLLNPSNLPFVEELFEQYQRDPNSVPPEWRSYFARELDAQPTRLGPGFAYRSIFAGGRNGHSHAPADPSRAGAGAGISLAPPSVRAPSERPREALAPEGDTMDMVRQ